MLAVSEDTLPVWEYEDFILERYKQSLIEPAKNFLSVGNDWNSTLKNVIIETNNTVDGLTIYRSMTKGVEVERRHGNFDMNKQVLKRLENKREKIIIRIHCNYRCPKSIRPILFIKAELLQNSRQKRKTRSDEDCSNRNCCLKTRYFQFRNSGLEHITAPDGFMMDFCDGICDQTLIPATNDRNVLVHTMKISDSHFNPFKNKWVCCVPIKFTSVNVAEQYNNGMQRSILLKNVKVAECGCVI
ncbi:Inhibin beta A chain [Dirofilaria immitis]